MLLHITAIMYVLGTEWLMRQRLRKWLPSFLIFTFVPSRNERQRRKIEMCSGAFAHIFTVSFHFNCKIISPHYAVAR